MELTNLIACDRCDNEVAATDQRGWCRGCVIEHRLTARQREVLMLVREHQPCTVGEIADYMGFASTNSAYHHLQVLRGENLIDWRYNAHRTIHETRW